MAEYQITDSQLQQPDTLALFNLAYPARSRLEGAWNSETRFHGLVPTPDDPPSRGQCGVSSLWFSRQLCDLGIQNVQFAEGDILLGGDAREGHCWIEVGPPEQTVIVDLTSDQYKTIFGTPVHVGYNYAHDGPARYVKKEAFDPFDVPHRKLLARHAILVTRLEQQRTKGIGKFLIRKSR